MMQLDVILYSIPYRFDWIQVRLESRPKYRINSALVEISRRVLIPNIREQDISHKNELWTHTHSAFALDGLGRADVLGFFEL